MATEMTVDQLLSQQHEAKPLATIDQVDGKPDLVKVTPWVRSQGCHCTSALVIPKAAVASVKPTGETHYCCGKQLAVVEISFKQDAHLTVTDVFAQVALAAGTQHSPLPGGMTGVAPNFVDPGVRHVAGGPLGFQSHVLNANPVLSQLMRSRPCRPTCMCWPDGCLCYWDCT